MYKDFISIDQNNFKPFHPKYLFYTTNYYNISLQKKINNNYDKIIHLFTEKYQTKFWMYINNPTIPFLKCNMYEIFY